MILSKPPAGDTDWASEINQNWSDLEAALTFTAGAIPFSDGTTLLGDVASLSWDNTNKLLGIIGLGLKQVSPSQITGDQDDWNLGSSSNQKYSAARVSTDASTRRVTGIAGGLDGKILHLVNIGAAYDLGLAHDSASSSAANRLYNASGTTRVLQPQGYTAYQYDDTTDRWREMIPCLNAADLPSDISTALWKHYDFVVNFASAASGTVEGDWAVTASGTGAAIAADAASVDATHPGVLRFTSGTTTTGRAVLHQGAAGILLGGGIFEFECLINIATLSDATEEYDLYVGLGDNTAGSNHTDGVYFKYDRNTSTNWIRSTASNGTRTETASSTAVATGWLRLKIVVNAAGSSAEFFVNGVSVGANAANIPTGAGRQCSPNIKIIKSAGTTARTFDVDAVAYRYRLSTRR